MGATLPVQETPFNLDPLLPPQMAARAEAIGVCKARMPLVTMLALSVLAGAFIAVGANLYTVVTADSDLGFGPTRLLGGVAFSVGLVLVVIAGAELFTGNNLIVMAWASRRITAWEVGRAWAVVYAGNFAGALGTVALVYATGQWKLADNAVGENAVRIAAAKTDLGFGEAIALGVLCNALVCLAVWLTYSARSNIDKIASVILPIGAFVTAGFEHSIANMYYIPLGLLVKEEDALTASLASSDLGGLTWAEFLWANLLPVTIGNMIGGTLLVGAVYWLAYLRVART